MIQEKLHTHTHIYTKHLVGTMWGAFPVATLFQRTPIVARSDARLYAVSNPGAPRDRKRSTTADDYGFSVCACVCVCVVSCREGKNFSLLPPL